MLNFDFFKKGLGIVFPTYFVHNFSRKMFLKLCSINWPNFIAWFPLFLEMLVNISIAIACWPDCDAIDFEINLIFLIKPFSYTTKKSRQKFKYLENERSFYREIKSIFHHFYKTFSCQKLHQTLECAFKHVFEKLFSPTSTYFVIAPCLNKFWEKLSKNFSESENIELNITISDICL